MDPLNDEMTSQLPEDDIGAPIQPDEEPVAGSLPAATLDLVSERRRFLRNTLVYGAGALALGGGIAAIQYANRTRVPASEVIAQQVGGADLPDELDINDLVELVNALSTENAQLKGERDSLRAELDSANEVVSDLREVNLLWARMDSLGIDGIIRNGLNVLGGIFPGIISLAAGLAARIPFMRGVIERFTGELPGPTEGIAWLESQVNAFSESISDLKEKLKSVIQPVSALTEALFNFVLWLLDNLPFGAGDLARASLEAMRDIISNLGGHLEGVRSVILSPLTTWFSEDDTVSLGGALFRPVTNDVLAPADDMIIQVNTLEASYRDSLEVPVSGALDERAAIRDEINQKLAAIARKERIA